LIALFPTERFCRAEHAEYNRQTIEELECARDFAILHYKGNRRAGQPFWDACSAMAVPNRLAHKIALYESCGRNVLHDGETFEAPQWTALFDALGYRPRRYDALANGIARTHIDEHFARIRDVMLKAVAAMPTHADYLRRLNR
jgi:tryptophan 7-halogenase